MLHQLVLYLKISLEEVHQRLKERRGTKRANVAIAHKLCRIIYSVLKNKTAYVEWCVMTGDGQAHC